ncbi:MAG: hypothetical protein K0S61_3058 [Anaerocolumna sp.]|jgi:hypothetical protein|nr:hypothetical protein [Anaerocolumna sp.]
MDNRKYIYTNSVDIILSPYDVQLKVEVKTAGRDGLPYDVEEPIFLLMSPVHAKALSLILEKNMNDYEKQFGEIKLPINLKV